jgi:hypothetical protein
LLSAVERTKLDRGAENAEQAAFNKILVELCDASIEALSLVKVLTELKWDMLAATA